MIGNNLPSSFPISLGFTYTASALTFDQISFSGSSSSSLSSVSNGHSGTVSISGSVFTPSSTFATITFHGAGTGTFNLDVSQFQIAGSNVIFIDPPPINFDLVIADTTAPTISAFSPVDAATGVAVGSDIVLTFSEAIQKGTGTIVIHSVSATGPVVQSYDVATSSNLTISGNTLTINPSSDLANSTHYFVTLNSGSIKDIAGNSYAGTSSYDFTTVVPVSSSISGATGNDIFHAGSGDKTFDGGAGVDTVIFSGKESDYSIIFGTTGFAVKDNVGADGIDTVINIEKLQFTDHSLSIAATPDAVLQESYRIYKAAFDRTPDYGGLGFWYKGMVGGSSLNDVALGFTHSKEFTDMYGTNPTDANFLTLLYQHVLGRAAEQGGYDFWLGTLTSHANTQAQVLALVSESLENIANVAGVIANGIIYEA